MARLPIGSINRAFKKALTEPIVSLYHYNGCGYFDGGCLLLADALVLWSQGDLKLGGFSRRSCIEQGVDHWFVTLDVADKAFMVDANALQTEKAFIRYWIFDEGLGEELIVLKNPIHRKDADSDVPRDLVFSALIARQIADKLGDYPQWRASIEATLKPASICSL